MDILKNPIIIGVIAAVIIYVAMIFINQRNPKKTPNGQLKSVNWWIPIIGGIIVAFLAYVYFKSQNVQQQSIQGVEPQGLGQAFSGGQALHSSDSFAAGKYHVLRKHEIKLPDTDVFIDIAKF